MRIFLCGAQGVGKSTLVNSVQEGFQLEKKDSYSRKFLTENPEIQNGGHVDYNEFQDKILLYCLNQYVNDKNFISSRSIIDSFAYLHVCDSENKVILTNLINHYKDYLTTKDCVYIYIPIEFEISDGGNELRNTDLEYQIKTDQQIQRHFEKLKRYSKGAQFYVIKGDEESRLQQLTDIIIEKKREEYV